MITMVENVHRMMHQAIKDNIFPGAVLLAAKADSIYLHEAYGHANLFTESEMTKDTLFDLASLTKPLATALAVMELIKRDQMRLEQQLGSLLQPFKSTPKAPITIKQLLCHNSGLPDYVPYYKGISQYPISQRTDALRKCLVREALVYPTGSQVLYSDLGFMILRWVIETIAKQRLNRLVEEAIYKPLGINDLFFIETDKKRPTNNCLKRLFAATEQCPWRNTVLEGVVHDENAYIVGGVEGHAGLFGTARALYALLIELLNAFHGNSKTTFFSSELVRLFWEPCGNGMRTPGFDLPSAKGSSSGRYFSHHSVGHLGFTGTSFWMEPASGIIIILLTNRVHPLRTNNKIRKFRPQLHDMIMKLIKDSA
ncbi:serine hydrolase [Desulfococcaceae bacterium HSG7]|nr:serine hydrolase [Desulfococcaceae bacterium HSG7]